MVQPKTSDQYLISGKIWTRAVQRFRRYRLLKTLTKNFNILCNANADADTVVTAIALPVLLYRQAKNTVIFITLHSPVIYIHISSSVQEKVNTSQNICLLVTSGATRSHQNIVHVCKVVKTQNYNNNWHIQSCILLHSGDGIMYRENCNIRILHVCEVQIENSFPRVTVWHHFSTALWAKQDPEGWNYLSAPNTHVWFCFLHSFPLPTFYFKSSIHYHT